MIKLLFNISQVSPPLTLLYTLPGFPQTPAYTMSGFTGSISTEVIPVESGIFNTVFQVSPPSTLFLTIAQSWNGLGEYPLYTISGLKG